MWRTKQNLRDQFNSFLNALGRRHAVPLPYLHFEAHNDLIFSVHITTGEELVHGDLSLIWAGSSQVGWGAEQPGLVESVPASGVGTRLRHLPTQIIYDSITSFHHLLPTTKHYLTCQHEKVNKKKTLERAKQSAFAHCSTVLDD